MFLRLTVPVTLSLAACAADPLPPEVPRPEVPEAIAVPEAHRVAFVGHATGVQIYECAPDASMALAWRLRAPRAELFDARRMFATHFGGVDVGSPAGPYWESVDDGSRVHGGNAASAPNPGHIPLLRLDALDVAGDGIFSRVTFIHRLATVGGVGPTGACTDPQARMEVPYESDYYFYEPS
jgi:hypothetical protein